MCSVAETNRLGMSGYWAGGVHHNLPHKERQVEENCESLCSSSSGREEKRLSSNLIRSWTRNKANSPNPIPLFFFQAYFLVYARPFLPWSCCDQDGLKGDWRRRAGRACGSRGLAVQTAKVPAKSEETYQKCRVQTALH